VLLSLFIFLYLLKVVLFNIGGYYPKPSRGQYFYFGTAYWCLNIYEPIELMTFFLVVHLLNPWKRQQQKCEEFRTFIFYGFVNLQALEAAILAQHPGLTKESLHVIFSDLTELDSFLGEARDTDSIISNMVNVVDPNDIAFRTYTDFVIQAVRARTVSASASDEPQVILLTESEDDGLLRPMSAHLSLL
jgi:hypothetical protein